MIELRINNQLCDLPDNFSVTLKRVFYDPTQLITKDAQSSYSISLPMTDTNKRIFRYKNVPEVTNRFGELYTASLVVDSQSIFEGDFRLDEITPDRVTGNLAIIFKYSLKDILEDKYMNECGEWTVEFGDFNESVETLNEKTDSECIFPLVMYGLLPKYPDSEGKYTDKNIYDDSVGFNISGFPPSINCIQMLQKVFPNLGLKLGGTALGDARLKNLYMSYKNPKEYEMPWNWGYNAIMKLNGKWSNYKNLNDGTFWVNEPTTSENGNPKITGTQAICNTDLLSNVNGFVDITADNGGNISRETVPIDPTTNIPKYTSRKIRIPYSGYYKVSLEASFRLNTNESYENYILSTTYGDKTVRVISPCTWGTNTSKETHSIKDRRSEIKVIVDRSNGSFGLDEIDIDLAYHEDAIQQTPTYTEGKPKYYPRGGKMCVIDPEQTKRLVCGISFGKGYGDQINAYTAQSDENENVKYTNPIALKGGYSYGADTDFQFIASPCDAYMKGELNEQGEVEYTESLSKFKEDIINTKTSSIADNDLYGGSGNVNSIVWFNQGDMVTVVHSCDLDRNAYKRKYGADMQDVSFDLSIEPFMKNKTWLTNKLNQNGDETISEIDFNEPTDFETDKINLIKFLPSNIKINDWITNFCNAFNLSLIQLDNTNYELNTNKRLANYGSSYIDISKYLYQGYNPTYKPLDIPSIYDLGFSLNEDERGYIESDENGIKENGGGKFKTWRAYGNTLTQTSIFSYCWYKDITFDTTTEKGVYKIPIISDNEPFALDNPKDYAEMQQKEYYDLAQRFWYKGDNIVVPNVNNSNLTLSLVKGEIDKAMRLDYHDEPLSIMRNFFAVITGSETSYTSIVCYLDQWMFNELSYSFVIFNNDVFFVSSVDSYNPITKIAQLKLIRKSIL